MLVGGDRADGALEQLVGADIVDIAITCSKERAVVMVTGELDVSNAARLFECLHGAMDSGITQIVVDIANLTYMDSTGLSVLFGANRRMRPTGGTLTVLSPTPSVKRLFDAAHVVPTLNVRTAA